MTRRASNVRSPAALAGAIVVIRLVAACTGSSTPAGTRVTVKAASGGTVALNGGPTLAIPPGALSADTDVTIQQSSSPAPSGAVSPRFAFGPSGTTFSQPVTVTMPITMTPSGNTIVFWSSASGDGFDRLPTVTDNGQSSAQVMHFSEGYVGQDTSTDTCSCATSSCTGTDAGVDGAPYGGTGTPPCGAGFMYTNCPPPSTPSIKACTVGQYECLPTEACYDSYEALLQDCAPGNCVRCH